MESKVKNLLLVASGKGGVGKSTVATNLALCLAQEGHKVGLLDADVYGPSLPLMLGIHTKATSGVDKKLSPIERHGIKVMSMGFLVDENAAMVWRGPMLAGAVTQFVEDVEWGDLDYLVFDLPPGTGDVQLTLAQKFSVTGAVLVSTPQSVALADVQRAKAMFDRVRIKTLGLIENMGYFSCPNCGVRHHIFDEGGGGRLAQKMGVPYFGSIPLVPKIREAGDAGVPIVVSEPDSDIAQSFREVCSRVVDVTEEQYAQTRKDKGPLPIVMR